MSRHATALFVSLLLVPAANAAWYPVFEPSYVQLRPGETLTLSVRGAWLSGISPVPFLPMTFVTEDATVATVQGSLSTTAATPLRVTGHRPGVTRIGVVERGTAPLFPTSPVIVVAEQELPVAIGVHGVLRPGNEITLNAVSDAPDATFTWFSGRLGGLYTWEAGSGRELSITPMFAATYEYWVLMTTPSGAGSAGVVIDVVQPPGRRRAAGR